MRQYGLEPNNCECGAHRKVLCLAKDSRNLLRKNRNSGVSIKYHLGNLEKSTWSDIVPYDVQTVL